MTPTPRRQRQVAADRAHQASGADWAGQPAAAVPKFAYAPVMAIAALLAVLLISLSGRYGYHRDELYFLASGRHLAWGYPDQPPLVPLIARLMSDLAPTSLVVLRLQSAVAAAALVLMTALITRELGGGRAAQILAAASIAVAPLVIGSGHLLSTTTLDLPVWALVCWLVIRILRGGDDRLWLAVGLATGVGLFDTDLVVFLLVAVMIGFAVSGPRRPFTSIWLYAGGLIAVALWAPYLAWQASHGWPELAIARSIAGGGSGTSAPRWQLLPFQLVLLGVYLCPVWVAGIVRLLRGPTLRWCRPLGVAYVVLVVIFLIAGGKPYYLGGMFPVLLAAGAEPVVDWMRRGHGRARPALIVAGVVLTLVGIPVTLPVVPVADVHSTPIVALNYDAGETIGWPAYVHEIAAVYDSLPASQRRSSIVLTSNYGEAGAVGHFGPAVGLPAVYSGHNGYWYWGPPPAAATTAVAVGFDRQALSPLCGTLRLAARLNNQVGVHDDEQGAPVWVCSALRASWAVIWPGLRDFG